MKLFMKEYFYFLVRMNIFNYIYIEWRIHSSVLILMTDVWQKTHFKIHKKNFFFVKKKKQINFFVFVKYIERNRQITKQITKDDMVCTPLWNWTHMFDLYFYIYYNISVPLFVSLALRFVLSIVFCLCICIIAINSKTFRSSVFDTLRKWKKNGQSIQLSFIFHTSIYLNSMKWWENEEETDSFSRYCSFLRKKRKKISK